MNKKVAVRAAGCTTHLGKVRAVAAAVALLAQASGVQAAELTAPGSELKVRWDNTVKYSVAGRLKERSAELTRDVNQDDGNRNFGKGLISNRADLLSELDVTYGNVGVRVSGAAWYDGVYRGHTDNDSRFTWNPVSVPHTDFTAATAKLHGKKGELLDAFLFAKGQLGDMSGTVRIGRHALVYGETLFFGINGIAAAQQPIDVIKAQSVPGTQFKELIRPVGQVSGQLQINSSLTLGGYYQYRWEKSRIPAAGSYFATADFLDAGGERLLTGPTSAFRRGADLQAKDSGQGGLQLKWSPEGGNIDFGLYAAQYHDKAPQIVVRPGSGSYVLAYHENIRTYGVSATTTFGEFSIAAEASVRRNTPLSASSSADLFGVVPVRFGGPAAPSDNRDHGVYPVGNTAHFNMSTLASLGPSFIAQEATLLGEIAWNRMTSITHEASHLDPDAERDAWGMRLVYEPSYRQALPGWDVSVPLNLSYFPKGRSAAIGSTFGPDRGGDISIGISGNYQNAWFFGLNVTHYYGKGGHTTRQVGQGTVFNYLQSLKDRDFVSLSVRRTF